MDATARWRELIGRPDPEIPLDEAALLISAHANPGLDVGAAMGRLDELAAQVTGPDTDGVCAYLFGTCGFRGDTETYDDARNSYLDQVLARRRGIPITLSVLLIEVSRRVGVTLEGVGMPGHYLVRDAHQPDLLIDAFAGGRRLDHGAAGALLRRVAGPTATMQPEYLAPATRRGTLARMLANLNRTFRRSGDDESLIWVTRLQLTFPDSSLKDKVALAAAVAEHGRYVEAAALVDELAGDETLHEGVRDRLHAHSRGFRSRLN